MNLNVNYRPLTTAIICAYNEDRTIGPVIESAITHPCVDKVLVVNDGSTDDTRTVIESFKSEPKMAILSWSQNKGKGHAMVLAARAASEGILLFIDSDLVGFSHEHIYLLIEPVWFNHYKMVLGYPPRRFIEPFKWITGERALRKKDFMAVAARIETSGFGAETILNSYIGRNQILAVELPGLFHIRKHEKMPFRKCWKSYVFEAKDIYLVYQGQFLKNIQQAARRAH